MHEQIKKLYDEAWAETTDHYGTMQKFAELIVRDCIGVIEKLSPGYDDYRIQIEDAFRRDCIDEVKLHFGVKE